MLAIALPVLQMHNAATRMEMHQQ